MMFFRLPIRLCLCVYLRTCTYRVVEAFSNWLVVDFKFVLLQSSSLDYYHVSCHFQVTDTVKGL